MKKQEKIINFAKIGGQSFAFNIIGSPYDETKISESGVMESNDNIVCFFRRTKWLDDFTMGDLSDINEGSDHYRRAMQLFPSLSAHSSIEQ